MIDEWISFKTLIILATAWSLFALAPVAQAQQTDKSSEVYLTFQYRGVVSNYVTAYYKDGEFYLPVSELFSLLKINHTVDQGNLTISGIYLGETEYQLNFNNQLAQAANKKLQLSADDFLIKEIDYFLRPKIFDQLFGLTFTTNFNNLTLDLKTTDNMPVVAAYEREQKRKRLSRNEPLFDRNYYPLKYDRNYQTLDGAFLDYNLSAVYSNNSQLFTFNNSIGAEILAGDVQGNIFGSFSDQQTQFFTQGLRWRYAQRESDYLSSVIVGQTNSEGISRRAITGIKISNKPIQTRQLFDRFPIEGNVPAQSEVELYLNNRLVNYQQADESGNYRFLVPLTYGSTEYTVQIYTPSGGTMQRSSRIQLPFNFIPPGEVDYNISGGQLQNPILGSRERGYMGQANISAGITNWLTARGSTEYLSSYHGSLPSFTGTLNTRLFSKYLLSASANSENYYQLSSSVVYASGASWNLSYDYNPGKSRLYSTGQSKHMGRASLFTPFRIGQTPLNIRLSSNYQTRNSSALIRYRGDLSTRLGRLNIRFSYQDRQTGNINFEPSPTSRLTNSYTYTLGRGEEVPAPFRGMFIRGQLSYLPGLHELEEMEFHLSRDLFRTGRMQLSYGRNFLGDFNSLSLNVTIDFNNFRTNTSARTTGSNLTINQNMRGSISYDSYGNQLLLNNRQQVGQAGAAVRMFVDKNNDGAYQDSTDDMITDPAVRINRATGQTKVSKGINYISKLLPYYRYDIEINKGALSNPLLVPEVESFSIVTDPNQYKTIEIPFYLSGVISGQVKRKQNGKLNGLSGLRLYLESRNNEETNRKLFSEEIRTFSDGSFYLYEIPPGKYNLFIDPKQLEFLNGVAKPDTMQIEVESLAQGDFIENLNFVVHPRPQEPKQQDSLITNSDSNTQEKENKPAKDNLHAYSDKNHLYQIQLASFGTAEKAKQIATSARQQLKDTFSVIKNSSNDLYAIRGNRFDNRTKALEKILSYYNSFYTDAALVVISKQDNVSEEAQEKIIQLGAFSSQSNAEIFAGEMGANLGRDLAIFYHQPSELYKVYIEEHFQSDQEHDNLLQKINKHYSFEGAFVNKRNQIQVGAFLTKNFSNSFANISEQILGIPISTYYDSQTGYYKVYVDNNFSSAVELQSTLSEIRNTSSAFADAFITSTTDKYRKRRDMDFRYQVQIQGVSQQSENAFLSSILDQTDTTLEQPEEDLIIFDHISSWNEAQKLKRKLSQVSTIGHPIIIMIENANDY